MVLKNNKTSGDDGITAELLKKREVAKEEINRCDQMYMENRKNHRRMEHRYNLPYIYIKRKLGGSRKLQRYLLTGCRLQSPKNYNCCYNEVISVIFEKTGRPPTTSLC